MDRNVPCSGLLPVNLPENKGRDDTRRTVATNLTSSAVPVLVHVMYYTIASDKLKVSIPQVVARQRSKFPSGPATPQIAAASIRSGVNLDMTVPETRATRVIVLGGGGSLISGLFRPRTSATCS